MPEISTALPDWQERIVARRSMIPPVVVDDERAKKALRIFKRLRVVDIPGKPRLGEVCAEWVFDLVRAIFGAHDPVAKRQLIREILLLIAKKNGKSTIAAGIMMTALIMNQRHQGEYTILAPTKDVADNSFDPARGMVEADPALDKVFKASKHTRQIVNVLDGSVLSVKSADADVVGGQKAVAVLVDELWLFGKKASAKNMLSEATGSLASRPEGFVAYLSTQSDDPPAGVFKEKLHYFRDVRDGKIVDSTSLPVIYEFPPAMLKGETWRDPAKFYIPNPSLGRSVDEQWLVSEFRKSADKDADTLRLFAAKHLNVEIGIGLRTDRWPGAEFWERRADPSLTLDEVLRRSEVVIVGIDGGGLDDLFGLAILGREKTNDPPPDDDGEPGEALSSRRWLLWSHAWCHKGVLERRKSIASVLEGFAAAGELTIVDDELGDVSAIVEHIERIKTEGLLGCVAVDPAGLGEFVDALAAIDVTVENKLLVGVGQGYRMMNAIKTAERRLANGTLLHGGSGLMAWCVGNLKIEPTATAIRATKQNAGDAKIDPVMALFDAVDVMSSNPQPRAVSYLETEDLLIL